MQARLEWLLPFKHVLTHKDLTLSPVVAGLAADEEIPLKDVHVSEPDAPGAWFTPREWPSLGLPAPIRKLLQEDAA